MDATISTARIEPREHALLQWLGLAVGVLLVSGLLAVSLVAGRVPVLATWLGQHFDAALFRRALVVHVDLALVVWFYAFTVALTHLLPGAVGHSLRSRGALFLARTGVVLMLASTLVPGAAPILANYIPVIDHPVYVAGLVTFGAGVVLSLFDRRLMPTDEQPQRKGSLLVPAAAATGLRTAAVALLVAALTFYGSALVTPRGLDPAMYYELAVWGGGHVLQVASEAAMVSVWIVLLSSALGEAVISPKAGLGLFALLLGPWLASPVLAMQGPAGHASFTRLMQFAIFPAVLGFAFLCVRALVRHGRAIDLRDVRILGFWASLGLTLAGFLIGATIRGSSTVIPGHYHAAIGAVTVSFMAVTWDLLRVAGIEVQGATARRLAALQPALFGTGQLVFAVGFGMAGVGGAARKAYASEQHIRTLSETVGLGIMGLGGLVAVAGGLLYLGLAVRAWRQSPTPVVAPIDAQTPSSWSTHEPRAI